MPVERKAQTKAEARRRVNTPNRNIARDYIKAVESGQALFGEREQRLLAKANARSGRVASNSANRRSAVKKAKPKSSASKSR
jgi:hypothetical protein